MTSLLPPNATPLERALEAGLAPLSEIDAPIDTLFDPERIAAQWLPWLAWGLSVDTWDGGWSEADKRAAVAGSIALHRIKGTRLAVETICARFDELLRIVEWHEAQPRAAPHTFEIHLPIAADGIAAGGTRSSAVFAEAIIRDIYRVKPLREHFRLVQSLVARARIGIQGTARLTTFGRSDLVFTNDTSLEWAALLQTEDGEPIEAGGGQLLDTSP